MANLRGVVLISALALACGGGGTPPPPPPPPPPPAPGPPASLAKQAGDNQTANAGEAVPVAPSVKVTDAAGKSLSGVTVTFAVASGGGTVTGATPATGSDGVATVGSWVLGTDGGVNTLSATVAGSSISGNPGLFTATGQLQAFAPTANTVLQGSRTVASVLIPAGVTVTVAHDAVLTVKGDATIAGIVTGDCVALEINTTGKLTITGTVTNVCSTPPNGPAQTMRLIGKAGYELNGATITPAGGLLLVDDLSAFPSPAISLTAASRTATHSFATIFNCNVVGTTIMPPSAAKGATSANGATGADTEIRCAADALISGATIAAQRGGDGGAGVQIGNSQTVTAVGGNGGSGGALILLVKGKLTVGVAGGPATLLRTGSGGDGGSAIATGQPNTGLPTAPGARAIAGNGGLNGDLGSSALRLADVVAPLTVDFGNGGSGGMATAVGADGSNAGTAKAQPGGLAWASPGSGSPTIGIADFNALLLTLTGGNGGDAGGALAHSGRGGNGSPAFLPAADGGEVTIDANSGGDSRVTDVHEFKIGKGGDATALRTAAGGNGGDGGNGCPSANGGNGGRGGDLSFGASTPGSGKTGGASRPGKLDQFGNGGNGGNGVLPGLGNLSLGQRNQETVVQPSLQFGSSGGPCAQATTVAVTDNSKGEWSLAFISDDNQTFNVVTKSGATWTFPYTPGQTDLTTITKSLAGSTRGFYMIFPLDAVSAPKLQQLLDNMAVSTRFGTVSFTCANIASNIISMLMAGLHTFSFLGPNGEPTSPCILVQVPIDDPYIAFVMRNSSNTIVKLFGANVPLNANSLDLSGALDPAPVPVTVSGANVTTGTIVLHLEAADAIFAEHLTTRSPTIGAFSGSAPTTIPLFPTVPAGSVQAVTAYGSPAGPPTSYIVGGVNFFGSAPATATLTIGPPSATLPTATKLVNTVFTQIQVTIPFDPHYDGSYAIEISSQTKGGQPVFTALIPREVINGATYIFTVPNVTDMDKVLPAGDAYAVFVTRTGGYAGPPTMMLPAPIAGTSIIFDRTFISIL